MTTTPEESGAGAMPLALPSGRFAGREAFAKLVRDAVATAAREGWRELVFVDAGFEDWPLHERAVCESLQAWSKSGRSFLMVARNYDRVLRDKHRFVSWRRTWSHIIECRQCRQIDAPDFPGLIWSPHWALRRLDPVHVTGVCGGESDRRTQVRELIDELLSNSSAGFPATQLGL